MSISLYFDIGFIQQLGKYSLFVSENYSMFYEASCEIPRPKHLTAREIP